MPTKVLVDLNIRSMGPISEVDMTYSMDTYFRQTWSDERLRFSKEYDELFVSTTILDQMWIPDTYFYNGLGSYLHTTTVPNKLLRIRPNGEILYSMRITIKASCPMYLHYFPIDVQSCPLQFGSYAYTKEQVVYEWKLGANQSIETALDMQLSQFDLVRTPADTLVMSNNNISTGNTIFGLLAFSLSPSCYLDKECKKEKKREESFSLKPYLGEKSRRIASEYSTLRVNFVLQRHMGYFLIQVYVPCTLIVVLSWVSFWINREAVEDRVNLGILAELTLTTVSMDTRDDLPKVPYPTALDYFNIMCYLFVTATLIEFAIVHYFTKTDSKDDIYPTSGSDSESENEIPACPYHSFQPIRSEGLCPHHRQQQRHRKRKEESLLMKFWKCLQGSYHYRKAMARRATGVNSLSRIDKISRTLFPFSFIFLNVIYWISITKSGFEYTL
ncbi:hypothetical protein CAPTEDRAFT_148069 [Capitella teleta]|uniref:Neurotransmitter-gated ion-channel ligand-binding domain-containing protein n=1 Tax=Capitella teleta TaxID=283909 RepID=R7UNK1_CAPTE|nr:hypothetical protein CAPTEDRAFT_148069 [Capitella teleta]|eukprot:ELU08089.1 hypothetical protein CAPTEDRAFT_148069 [Capitella teleta]